MTTPKQLIRKIQCLYCHLYHVKRDGCTIKGAQRFYCYNCRRYWQNDYIRASKAFEEQKELFAWAQMYPVLMNHLLTIVDGLNGRRKNLRSQIKTKDCDVLLAYPMNSYHGLWIKLKQHQQATKANTREIEQPWIHVLQSVGYEVRVAYGWKQAAKEIMSYLALEY